MSQVELAERVGTSHQVIGYLERGRTELSAKWLLKLADALGLSGTPSYVIGSQVVIGAVGLPNLQEKINAARCGKPTC